MNFKQPFFRSNSVIAPFFRGSSVIGTESPARHFHFFGNSANPVTTAKNTDVVAPVQGGITKTASGPEAVKTSALALTYEQARRNVLTTVTAAAIDTIGLGLAVGHVVPVSGTLAVLTVMNLAAAGWMYYRNRQEKKTAKH